jgi:hypothetical protein
LQPRRLCVKPGKECQTKFITIHYLSSVILTFVLMIRKISFVAYSLLLLLSCNNTAEEKKVPASENDVDAARNFIRASLDGKWSEAKKFMVGDPVNVQLLETAESQYQTKGREEKRGYREASITLYDSRQVNDSTTIVKYANTFKNIKDSLKVVNTKGQWLIDLKYSLLPIDTARHVQ